MAWKTTSRDSKTDVPLAKSQFNLDILSNPYVLTNAQLKQLLKSKCITVEDDTSREVLLSQCLKFIAPRPQRSPRTSRRGYRLHQQFQLQNKQHQQQQQHPSEAYSKQSLNDHSHQQETRQLNFSRAKYAPYPIFYFSKIVVIIRTHTSLYAVSITIVLLSFCFRL